MKENAFLGVKFLGTPLEAWAYGSHYLGYLPTLPHIPSTLRVNETPAVNHLCYQYLAKNTQINTTDNGSFTPLSDLGLTCSSKCQHKLPFS